MSRSRGSLAFSFRARLAILSFTVMLLHSDWPSRESKDAMWVRGSSRAKVKARICRRRRPPPRHATTPVAAIAERPKEVESANEEPSSGFSRGKPLGHSRIASPRQLRIEHELVRDGISRVKQRKRNKSVKRKYKGTKYEKIRRARERILDAGFIGGAAFTRRPTRQRPRARFLLLRDRERR